MQDNFYFGIDPGASGGIATTWAPSCVLAVPMPKTEGDVWKEISSGSPPVFAVIEKVGGYIAGVPAPGSAMFNFGVSYGGLRMALIAAGIPFEEVTPQRWQKAMGIAPRKNREGETKTQFKNRLKAFAQRLYPAAKVTLAVADAILIATYCQRKYEGRL